MSNFWDKEEIMGEVTKNKRGETIRVRLCEMKGRSYVDVRTMYPSRDGSLLPGKGITIPLEVADEVCSFIFEALSNSREDKTDNLLEAIIREVDSSER